MSLVTNYMILPSCDADVEALNSELAALTDEDGGASPQPAFAQVDQHAGGGKAMEVSVWLLATNYFTPTQMLPVLQKVRWHLPCRFLFCGQEDDAWTVLDAMPVESEKPRYTGLIDLSACKEKP